jgi:peptide chain release factor 2
VLRAELGRWEKQLLELSLSVLTTGPHDNCGAYITIDASSHTNEACAWAEMLLTLYTRWSEQHGQAAVIAGLRHEEAGIRTATLHIPAPSSYARLKGEAGLHRLVRISPFDPAGRRFVSSAAVTVLPDLPANAGPQFQPDDLLRNTFRTGGPGGQHL